MGRISIESAKTVLEVAELAFKTVEFSHNHPLPHKNEHYNVKKPSELEGLRMENEKLRALLQENVKLLQNISDSPCLLQDCPPDLHTRIMDTVESPKFLDQLKTLRKDSVDGIPGLDLRVDEILINVGHEEPSLWIWVSDEMLHENVEEKSGIDNDNYVVISQEQVLDAIGNFMARCALLNPKAANMTPEEMQKRLTKAFRSMSKFEKLMELWHAGQLFYLMATWGLTLAGSRFSNLWFGRKAQLSQPTLYDGHRLLKPSHALVTVFNSHETLLETEFVPQNEDSREQVYWLSASDIASQSSDPPKPVTPFVHTRPVNSEGRYKLDAFCNKFHIPVEVHHVLPNQNDTMHERPAEMILRDGDMRLTLNMRHDTSSYSNQPQKESINLINVFNDSDEDFLENLFSTNQPSGNPTFSSHPELTSPEVKDDIFDPEEGNVLPENLLDLDSTKDLHPPLHVNPLNSINQINLANLVDSMPEMFTNEHALDYSSPSLFDEYDDDLFEVKSNTENVYEDPFNSKGEKIKVSKLLIDELDLPCDFLLPSEYDSILSEDFSRVDALPSTNNEDKVFNTCILIQENLFEITTHAVQDKKLAISHASLMIEDFDPPLYELLFFKEVPRRSMSLDTSLCEVPKAWSLSRKVGMCRDESRYMG
nr:elongation factor 4 [Tanacetum cinerariifolium]